MASELQKIAIPLGSPTMFWSKKSEMQEFLKSNPSLNFQKAEMPRDFFIGEIALISGWFLALKNFLDTNNDLLLVFEDDLWFNNDQNAGVNQVNKIIHNLPGDTDLLVLYSPEDCFDLYKLSLNVNTILCESFSTWSLAFTLLTREGARKILTLFHDGINVPLDALLLNTPRLVRYALQPESQTAFFSVYARTWIGSTIDPREGLVPAIYISEDDLL